jgi:hypothetical protein
VIHNIEVPRPIRLSDIRCERVLIPTTDYRWPRRRGYSQSHWRKVRAGVEHGLHLRLAKHLTAAADKMLVRALLGGSDGFDPFAINTHRGGPVKPGRYVVGERGSELRIPGGIT